MFANGNFILGDGAADNGYKLAVEGNVYIETIANAITDTDRFIVSDGGVIKYRTGTELLGDIGAQGSITLTTTGTSGAATLIGNTLNIPQYTDQFVGTVTSVAALTLGTSGTDLSSTVANSTTTPVITLNVPTASAVNRGALSAADWTTFNNKQPAGNYITSLIGEATATGPGAASVTLDNTAVIGKVLTGLNVTGGTIISTDNILSAFGKVQNQINGLIGGSIFQGTWNASTNTPTLTSGVGTNGHYYIVSVDGSTNLDGITDWKVGDWAIFAGTSWEKVDNTDAVNSVNGYTGIVSLVTGDVLEGAGTLPGRPSQLYFTDARSRAAISLTTTGTSGPATYSNVTGILNIPNYTTDLTGYVPYTGATQNLNLGTFGLIGDFVQFNTAPTSLPTSQGTMYWDTDKETIDVILNGTTGSIFQDTFFFVKNQTGTLIPKGTVVRAAGTVGASGRILIAPFLADGTFDSKFCLGVTTENIADGDDGRVTYFGAIRKINTSAYANGTVLYASPSTAGGFTATEPSGPTNNIISVAFVVYSDTTNGEIFVRPTFVPSAIDISKSLNYTPANAATTLTINGVTYDLSANRSWSVGTVNTLTTTGTSGPATLIGSTLNIPNYTTDLSGYVTLATDQTITGLKTIMRVGAAIDVLDFKIGTDTIYGLKVAYNQNELEASGEATWSLVNTFNRDGAGFSVTPISFFRGVLVTGERLLSASINSNLLSYYSSNPTGRYPIYAYNTGVQQFASSIIVGETAGVVNAITGAIADLPSGVVANFKGRVIGSDAVNNNEFATLGQVTSTSRAAISLTTTGTSGPATYSSVTGVLNIPEYQGGVTSFNTRTGAVTLTSSDVTTALGYTPVTDARTLTINGESYDLTANRSWTVGVNPSAREIQTYIATASQTTFTVTGGYTVGLVDVFINGVRLTSSDYTATNGTTVVLTVGTMAGNIVDIIKYTSGIVNSISGSGTTNELAYFTASTTIASLTTATYPSLTELSYVKGVTSSIQTQLNGKQNALTNPVTGTGTTNYLPKFTGVSTIGNSQIFDNGTNVGIGTSSPTMPIANRNGLVIRGGSNGAEFNLQSTSATDGTSVGFALVAFSTDAYYINRLDGNHIWATGSGGNTERMRIWGATGNVNIGPTPASDAGYKLDVNGTGRFDGTLDLSTMLSVFYSDISTGNNRGIRIVNTDLAGGATYNITVGRTGVNNGDFTIRNSTTGVDNLFFNRTTGAATFSSSVTATRMTVNSDNSGVIVDVGGRHGLMKYANFSTGLVGATSGTDNNISTWLGRFSGSITSPSSVFQDLVITTGGNVGIGTVSPSAILHTSVTTNGNSVGALIANPNQAGTADSISINFGLGRSVDAFLFSIPAIKFGKEQQWTNTGSTVDGYLAFSTMLNETVSEHMRISSGGNVGIGTDSPAAKLDISGGDLYVRTGGIIYSNTYSPYSGNMTISLGGSGNNLIVSGGNVGIGTTSPGQKFQVNGNVVFNGGTGASTFNDVNIGGIGGWSGGEAHRINFVYNTAQSPLNFTTIESHFDGTNGRLRFRNIYNAGDSTSIAMTIEGNGNVLIGTTADSGYKMTVNSSGSGILWATNGSANSQIFLTTANNFIITNGNSQGVILNSGATSWSSYSDIRLKNIIGNIENSLDAIKSLSAIKYTLKADLTNKKRVGLIAQEVQKVLPESVEVDEKGMLSLRYTELIPLLTAAIQELKAELDELKSKN
jgi:hypothetical protein